MGLGAMIVVWVAWQRLTILGAGAAWAGMGLGHKTEPNRLLFKFILSSHSYTGMYIQRACLLA